MDSNQSNTGLLRFRSAPGLQFDYGDLLNGSKANSESERLFSRFCEESESLPENSFRELDDKSAVAMNLIPSSQHHKYGSRLLPPHYPRPGLNSNENGSFGLLSSSMAMEDHHHHHHQGQNQVKSLGSNLVRQSSSPAGLFSQISLPNGFGSHGEANPSPNRLKTQMSFSSRLSSSLGILSQISELGNEGTLDEEKLRNGNGDSRFFGSEYPYSSWNDSSNFTENFGGLRRDQDSDRKLNSSIQNEEFGSRIPMLSHHLSLPKNSVEVERYLHFQDSVPCKVRAKRGCATHPRSIAERVRRTRISERMRKLQDLVPNMDKQTNTADMLDLAVDYIKELQKQFKSLSDKRANCKCINLQKKISNQVV